MRHAIWGLLALGCIDRAFEEGMWRERCPRAEKLVRVAADETIRLTWTDVQEGREVDAVVLGRLPVSPLELQSGNCRDNPREDYTQTEVVPVEPGSMAVLIEPDLVGPIGTTTRASLRSVDIIIDSILFGPTEQAEQGDVVF
jgi:hypothetical protein